jgi:hypothetical protein
MMLDALYWLAAAMALAGVRKGNLVALPLLASFAFCLLARAAGLPFILWLWLAVDVLVFAAVAWPLVPIIRARAWVWLPAYRTEIAILALFVPALAAYAMPEGAAYVLSSVAATVQLLVTFPYRRFWSRIRNTRLPHSSHDDFDFLRVRA